MLKSRVLVAALTVAATIAFWGMQAMPAQAVVTLSGVGTYCSVTWSDGRWAFTSDSTGNGNPCASAQQAGGGGGTVRHKGLYRSSATNNVVARCNSSQTWVVMYQGSGNGPLTAAFNAAKNAHQTFCTFVAAPKAMPVFTNPFKTQSPPGYAHWSGYDFAKPPYYTLKPSDFGQTGTTAVKVMDWLGRDKTQGYIDDHDGDDLIVKRYTPIYAVAAGRVVMARDYQSPCGPGNPVGSDSVAQKEVAIEHVFAAPNGQYFEKFVTYYAHFSSYVVKAGDVVSQGQLLGYAGSTGCSSTVHLHFGVFRTTNTAQHLTESLQFNTQTTGPNAHNNGRGYTTNPYGFYAPKGFDPWAWRAYPQGALSINLWGSNQAPPTGNW